MMLAPREIDKMMIWTAAQIAEGRRKKGVKLNYPETVAYIANYVVEGAREGKSVAELMKELLDQFVVGAESLVGFDPVEQPA